MERSGDVSGVCVFVYAVTHDGQGAGGRGSCGAMVGDLMRKCNKTFDEIL